MIKYAKRLHDMGLAIIWIMPNSKRPLEKGWQSGARKTWRELEKSYRSKYNMGVRLGAASQCQEGGYLAAIDCDVKSELPAHLKEMRAKLKELIQEDAPTVMSGRGNGSRHLYVRTKEPVAPFRYAQSPTKVKVIMPSVKATNAEFKALKAHEIAAGVRLRAAWEISVMGEGQQVVLPPSIHPDTGGAYAWAKHHRLERFEDMPLISFSRPASSFEKPDHDDVKDPFKVAEIDLLECKLPDSTVDLIMGGGGCTDKSAALFVACIHMVKAGFTDNEILTVLTDRSNYLGDTAYEHASTSSRKRAADWVRRYTLAKVKADLAADVYFDEVVGVAEVPLSAIETKKQTKSMEALGDWRGKLERVGGDDGRPKPTLKNLVLLLKGDVAPHVFKYDSFSLRTSYGLDAPWGGKSGEIFKDVDAVNIKHWLACNHRVEPPVNIVWEAMQTIASENEFHPVREYLEGLAPWDEVPRIHGYLKTHFNAVDPAFYLDEVFEKFLVAAVTRVYEPGAKHDWMLILEGDQDIGKSSFIEILASSKYFIDKLPDFADKDAAQALQGIWLVEMGELKELKKAELGTIKGFITRRVDKFRPPYGRATLEVPRQCVFAGSTNSDKYLRDDTGNRRFTPVRLAGHLNFSQLEKDRDQLWAEAFAIYKSGFAETSELSIEAKKYQNELHKTRMVEDDSDVMQERILDALGGNKNKDKNEQFNFTKFKLLELFDETAALGTWRAGGYNYQLAGKALKRLGGKVHKSNGRHFWSIPEKGKK